jgi:UDP-glucose 6-dehydrogenase
MVKLLLNNVQLDDIYPSIGTIGYKAASAKGHLLEGSKHPDRLTMLHDAESANISAIISYAEIIMRQPVKKVTILGICEKGDQKDIRLSPSLILAERLLAEGMTVFIHDPFFTEDEVSALLPGAGYIENLTESPHNECLLIMAAHNTYCYHTQTDLDNMGISSAKLVIDNVGLWKDFHFSENTLYHVPGDGSLDSLEQ